VRYIISRLPFVGVLFTATRNVVPRGLTHRQRQPVNISWQLGIRGANSMHCLSQW